MFVSQASIRKDKLIRAFVVLKEFSPVYKNIDHDDFRREVQAKYSDVEEDDDSGGQVCFIFPTHFLAFGMYVIIHLFSQRLKVTKSYVSTCQTVDKTYKSNMEATMKMFELRVSRKELPIL